MKKAATQTSNDLRTKQSKVKLNPIPYKEELCIWLLLRVDSGGVFQLEASNDYGETALHSSVSALQNRHGIYLARKPNPHTHRHGGQANFTRYWLMDEIAKQRALNRLDFLRTKRGLDKLPANPPYNLPYIDA
jgi:hypothetical protein